MSNYFPFLIDSPLTDKTFIINSGDTQVLYITSASRGYVIIWMSPIAGQKLWFIYTLSRYISDSAVD